MVSVLTVTDQIEEKILYQELFIKRGDAQLIGVERFADPEYALAVPECRIADLMFWRMKNIRISKPSIHLMVAFHPSETPKLTDDVLLAIAEKYMLGLGFVDSPYLVYRRNDHEHLHIHIITVGFDREGNTVSQSFIHNKCNRIRKNLEIEYGLIHASGRREWKQRLKSNQS